MSGKGPRTAWIAGVLATSVAAGVAIATPAFAVVGDEAKEGQYAFTAKIDIGGDDRTGPLRSCTGALVESQWVLTAASCFADSPAQGFRIPGGAPKVATKVTVGRTDLTHDNGTVVEATELVPRGDRDLVMVKLKAPVAGVKPVELAKYEPKQGDELRIAGYGRTKDEWAPVALHSAAFGVSGIDGASLSLTGKAADATTCKGDSGSPAFREKDGTFELAAVNNASGQGGCFGIDETETRKGVGSTRVDDVADWVQQTYSRTLLSRSSWKNARLLASGHFTDGGATNSKRRMDLFVVWADGSASIFQGADHSDPKTPFSAEYKVAKADSYWKGAETITGTRVAEDGSDGITVRWASGKLSTYTHVDLKGFHDEKTLAENGSWWTHAKAITAGRFTGNALRDDLLVLWENGSTSMYSDTGVNGVGKETQLTKADAGWNNAQQIAAGEFAGKKTGDLMVQWNDGQNQVFPGVDTAGYHGRTEVRPVKSAWSGIAQMTVGNFTSATGGPSDLLVRWKDGNLSYYPGVTGTGTPNGEVQLVG
ncbi:trypsin-like serine protease [Streptomyces sp. NPDC049555]|uniref:S1 family peptidase n=1 Tax=unclassified Streptomyces TaxID=2593676 RepID=UPI003448EB0D